MRWSLFAVLLAVGGIVYLVDQIKEPPSDCERTELGCQLMKDLKADGTINEFESKEPEGSAITTWEIDDDDDLLLHFNSRDSEVQYPSAKEALAREISDMASRYQPPESEVP